MKEALDGLFAEAARELVGLPDPSRQGRALRSLLNHREGLSVFVDRPQVPLDNNRAERFLRGPAIGRRLSFGSDSEDGARFTAIMYSVVGTLSMNGIDVRGERSQTTGRPVAVAAMVDERGAQARTHGAGVTGAIECRYYGRDFSAGEMALLRALIAGPPPLNRHMLSKEFCRRIGWFKPDGGLKDMMARADASASHVHGRFPELLAAARGGPVEITLAQLKGAGSLPADFSAVDALGRGYRVLILAAGADVIDVMATEAVGAGDTVAPSAALLEAAGEARVGLVAPDARPWRRRGGACPRFRPDN